MADSKANGLQLIIALGVTQDRISRLYPGSQVTAIKFFDTTGTSICYQVNNINAWMTDDMEKVFETFQPIDHDKR